MYRIKKDALVFKESKFFYRSRPFSGIVFELVDQHISEISEYRNGKKTHPYSSEYIPWNTNDLCVDQSTLLGRDADDFEPFLYDGVEFSGVAYDFDGNYCVGETYYIKGISWAEATWHLTGELASFSSSYHGVFQAYEWYDNGFFESINFCISESHTLELKFMGRQEINYIDISIDFFKNIPKFKHHLKHPFLESHIFSKNTGIAPSLFLSSRGIEDQVFYELRNNPHFFDLQSIVLFNTTLSRASIMALKRFKQLKHISIDDSRNDIIKACRDLKHVRTDCFIELNDIEII